MKTINTINTLIREFELRIERSVARTEKEFHSDLKLAQGDVLRKFKMLRQLFPELLQINYDESVSTKETEMIINNLRKRVKNKYCSDLISTGEVIKKTVCGTDFYLPFYSEWQTESAPANYVINYNKASQPKAQKALNTLVGNMLISLPIKAVHLNFVDLDYTGYASLFTQHLDKTLFRDLIVSSQQLYDLCKEMQGRMVTLLQECGDLPKYNKEHLSFKYPYEVIVLLDYPNMYDYVSEQLVPLFKNGHKGGIYFVVMHNTDAEQLNGKTMLTSLKDLYHEIDLNKVSSDNSGIIHVTSLLDNQSISKHIFKYINEEATIKPKTKNVKADYKEMYSRPYLEMENSTLVIPVGEDDNGNPAIYVTNIIDHVSSFVMGTVGSGKSSFLKSIIVDAMLTYSPEDLQFYLLDFKGVEMNMFKDSKHVRTLLTNGNDLDMTIEIFRDLTREYERRNHDVFAAMDCKDITSYNKRCPKDKRLPQIFLIADECQLLFSSSNSKNIRKYNELTKMIVDLARLGRSTGIHLIFATQTLQGTDFPNDVLNVIHDKYLLRCIPADSERMIPDSSKYTEALPPGKVFCRIDLKDRVFQSYFFSDDERREIMGYIHDKAKKYDIDKPILIDGSQVFELTDSIIDNLPAKRNNIAALGCTIDLQRKTIQIPLKADDGENILFFGINDQEQVTRTVMNALTSIVYTAKNNSRSLHVSVIDNTGIEDGKYLYVLDKLYTDGLISIIRKRDVGLELHRIASDIISGSIEPTLLVILGQERMRDLRMNNEIELDNTQTTTQTGETDFSKMDLGSMLNSPFAPEAGSQNKKADIMTYRKALEYILDNGPQAGVNTLLQVDMPSKVLYDPYINASKIFGWFNHLVMLRSEEKAAVMLGLNDDVHLEQLPSEKDLVRAIYYSADRDVYQTFTPYVLTNN